MYTWFHFFILGRFEALSTRHFLRWQIIVKYDLIEPKIVFREQIQAKTRQEAQLGTELQILLGSRTSDEVFNPLQEVS